VSRSQPETSADWLPSFIELNQHEGSWSVYLNAIYAKYMMDLSKKRISFCDRPVVLRRMPETDGMGFGFWHCISSGGVESAREPDFDRCRRIAWIRCVIENCSDVAVKVWSEKRGGRRDHLLWVNDEFVVVLSERGKDNDGGPDVYLLKTAFCTLRNHEKIRKNKAYEIYKKANAAPERDGA